MTDVQLYIDRLQNWFSQCESCIIAFSGGVNSSLVSFLARKYLSKEDCFAITAASESLKKTDLSFAKEFSKTYDLPMKVIRTLEINDSSYAQNSDNRCYHCKKILFRRLEKIRASMGFQYILGDEILDDKNSHRQGLKAAQEYNVRSPLAECEISKEIARKIANHLGLTSWDRPASPCLSSRIPHGQEITKDKLQQIELGENYLFDMGFNIARVRHYGDKARLEVSQENIEKLRNIEPKISDRFKRFGFKHIEIDPEGYSMGKLNRNIPNEL